MQPLGPRQISRPFKWAWLVTSHTHLKGLEIALVLEAASAACLKRSFGDAGRTEQDPAKRALWGPQGIWGPVQVPGGPRNQMQRYLEPGTMPIPGRQKYVYWPLGSLWRVRLEGFGHHFACIRGPGTGIVDLRPFHSGTWTLAAGL